jgi:hypothetical protein
MNFRVRIQNEVVSGGKLAVVGKIARRGNEVVLDVKGMYFHLRDQDIRECIGAGFGMVDFMFANRPVAEDNRSVASRTSGFLEFTVCSANGQTVHERGQEFHQY